jgi:cation transporter-like permease
MRTRTGWLIIFCIGLLLAALVVEEFEDILKNHVELSIFVPLIMGHGGNTGSQTVATVVRALALKQVTHMDIFRVVMKEAGAGCLMGRCTAGGGHDMLGLPLAACLHSMCQQLPQQQLPGTALESSQTCKGSTTCCWWMITLP